MKTSLIICIDKVAQRLKTVLCLPMVATGTIKGQINRAIGHFPSS